MQNKLIINDKKLKISIVIKKNYISSYIKDIAKKHESVFCVVDSKIKKTLKLKKIQNVKMIFIQCGESVKTIIGYRKLWNRDARRKKLIINA